MVLRLLTWLVPVAILGLLYSQGILGPGPAHPDALRLVVGGIIAIVTIWFFLNFAESLRHEGSPNVESHWGGLGGGGGGWSISASLVYLVGLIGFGLLLVLVIPPPKTGAGTPAGPATAPSVAPSAPSGPIPSKGTGPGTAVTVK